MSANEIRTFASTARIMGHMLFASVSRSEKEPLIKLGQFSNKVMIVWAVAVSTFLFLVVGIPQVTIYFKLSTLTVD